MSIHAEIEAFKRQLEARGKTQEIYITGAQLYDKYGPAGNIKRLISLGQAGPRAKHWAHLLYQLDKISNFVYAIQAAQAQKTQARPEPPKKAQRRVKKTAAGIEMGIVKIKTAEGADIESTAKRIRELATKRALLTNQLVDPKGDPELIAENCKVLDQLEPLNEEIKELKLRKQELIKIDAQADDPILVERKKESYRLSELYSLSISDLESLKRRVRRDQVNNSQPHADAKVMAKRQQKAKKAEYAYNVINKVISDKKVDETVS